MRAIPGRPQRVPLVFRMPPQKERPMYLIVGRRGTGKTLMATEIAVNRMRAGDRVYANYGITDWDRGLRAGRVHSLLDLLDMRQCTVVVDEANLWANSRQWGQIPADVISRWQLSRKEGLSLIFTSQDESRVDKIIRELCDWILVCERPALVPKFLPVFRCYWTWLEQVAEVRRGGKVKPELHWMPRLAYESYDTNELIDPDMLEKVKAYRAAIEAGEAVEYPAPPRTEPMRFSWERGVWEPWDDACEDGGDEDAEVERAEA